jgi:hypothetical protein
MKRRTESFVADFLMHLMSEEGMSEFEICHDCGVKQGTRIPERSTMWVGKCHICGTEGPVTSSRDYGMWKREAVEFPEV